MDANEPQMNEDDEFAVGRVVWAKLRGFPPWPAQIADESRANEEARRQKSPGKFLVQFFGTGEFAWVLPSHCSSWASKRPVATGTASYTQALKQARAFLRAAEKGEVIDLASSCVPDVVMDGDDETEDDEAPVPLPQCATCQSSDSAVDLISCRKCSSSYHMHCLSPPLDKVKVPRRWLCDPCTKDTEGVGSDEEMDEVDEDEVDEDRDDGSGPDEGDESAADARCVVCEFDGNDASMLLCDGCDQGYHLYCLDPPLKNVPKGEWFCPECVPKFEAAQPVIPRGQKKKSNGKKGKKSGSDESGDDSDVFEADVARARAQRAENPVEKILGKRVEERDDGSVEMFLVKWRDRSYRHASWVSADEVDIDSGMLRRFMREEDEKADDKEATAAIANGIYFDESFSQVERVICYRENKDKNGIQAQVLVKWRGLPYSDVTWEKIDQLEDDLAIGRHFRLSLELEHGGPPQSRRQRPFSTAKTRSTYKGGNVLRPYQLEGVNWLLSCWCDNRSSLLGDEMGLGKTVQSMAFLECLRTIYRVPGPFLVVAPLSTLNQWAREAEAWTDMHFVLYHGNAQCREVIRRFEFPLLDLHGKRVPGKNKFHGIICSYETLLTDRAHLTKIAWKAAVIDEAHRLKNRDAKVYDVVDNLKCEHHVLLSGTPLQNNVEELFTLMTVIDKKLFRDKDEFMAKYGTLDSDQAKSDQAVRLQDDLKPYLLRRYKEHVETSIPPKEETLVTVEITQTQKQYYRAIMERNRQFLAANKGASAPSLMNIMIELRKVCNHPFLIKGARDRLELQAETDKTPLNDLFTQCSGKMVFVDKLLTKLSNSSSKQQILVFSQMVMMLDLIQEYLEMRGFKYERIDGSVSGNNRQAAMDRFTRPDSDRFVFLLSTRAGGQGINLATANTVLIFDSDWNPQNDIQAVSRCHRIGQKQQVKVYRLVTGNTYEAFMLQRASRKLGLERAVIGGVANGNKGLERKEIEELLKKGAYSVLASDDEKIAKFCAEDIDTILERSKRVVHENGKDALGDTFSRASFTSSNKADDVALDDPDFWAKVLPNLPLHQKLQQVLDRSDLSKEAMQRLCMESLTEILEDALSRR